MRRFGLTSLALTATLLVSLALSTAAQAVVVDLHALGQTSVQYPTDQANYVGVAMVPGTGGSLATAGVPVVDSAACSDPWLSSDLALPDTGLCFHHGGSVIHRNETFALTWDAKRRYWSGTRGYVEQFLRDVADGSGTLTSPYALTTQYHDSGGRAENNSRYGGGCIDYGNPNNVANKNTTCLFGSSVQTGPGNNYPAVNGCQPTNDLLAGDKSNSMFGGNDTCLTDGQLQGELTNIVEHMGILGRTQPGYTPLVVLLVPSRVEVCLDATATLCSANSGAAARFCSYHSHIAVSSPDGSRQVDYVVAPWTALTQCDEPDAPTIPDPLPPPDVLSRDIGIRLVSPLSQGQIAAIVNPALNGWFGVGGAEMNDNGGCVPEGNGLDRVPVGNSSQNPYLLQHEFNNAGVIEDDPFTYFGCAPDVILSPNFVVPSPIDQGELVSFDGSATASTLIVPNADYRWKFGDGTSGTGPSVTHSFAKAGYYRVVLTVTDRGGNVRSLSQTVEVLQPDGQPPSSGSSSGGGSGSSKFKVHLQLLPQSLKDVLHNGLDVRVSSNEQADGFATLSVSSSAAKRAHIHGNRTAFGVVVGRGTVSGIKSGTVGLRVRVSSATASRLSHLGYLSLALRLALVDKRGTHLSVQATGRY